MQKNELIKLLEKFDDDAEVFISGEGLSEAFNIAEIKPLIGSRPEFGACLIAEEDEFPSVSVLKEVAQYILDYEQIDSGVEELLENLIDEIEG